MSEQATPLPPMGSEQANTNPNSLNGIPAREAADISMTDAPTDQSAQQPPQPPQPTTTTTPSAAPSPIPLPAIARIPTPTPGGAATDQRSTSRATSAHPDPTSNTSGATGFTMPAEAAAHGAPVRQYINSKITGVLLEGMKIVAREQPKDPLRVLGEFLLQRSRELEGRDSAS